MRIAEKALPYPCVKINYFKVFCVFVFHIPPMNISNAETLEKALTKNKLDELTVTTLLPKSLKGTRCLVIVTDSSRRQRAVKNCCVIVTAVVAGIACETRSQKSNLF